MSAITNANFSEVYAKNYNMVYTHILYNVNRNIQVAQELTNDVFMSAYTHMATYNSSYKISTWLITIAKNKVIDYFRSKQYKNKSCQDLVDGYTDENGNSTYEFTDFADNPEEIMQAKELKGKINAALSDLDEKYRNAVLMSLEGVKYEKIAEMLEMPVNTVKTRVSRAKMQLQEKLKGVLI
jgi:RNA polymerase sigma-70 factor (ECF subfamily)